MKCKIIINSHIVFLENLNNKIINIIKNCDNNIALPILKKHTVYVIITNFVKILFQCYAYPVKH